MIAKLEKKFPKLAKVFKALMDDEDGSVGWPSDRTPDPDLPDPKLEGKTDAIDNAEGANDLKKAEVECVDKWSRTPKSTMDQMVLDAAKQGKGQKIIDSLNDPNPIFHGMEKWSYGETSANGLRSEVHYVRDPKTGRLFDFKFKHHAETYR